MRVSKPYKEASQPQDNGRKKDILKYNILRVLVVPVLTFAVHLHNSYQNSNIQKLFVT